MSGHLNGGPIAVIGAGAFGTALAVAFARGGADVVLFGRDAEGAERMARTRRAEKGGATLPDQVTPTADPARLSDASVALLSVPAQNTRGVLSALSSSLAPNAPLALCAKGLEKGTLARQSRIAAEAAPGARDQRAHGTQFRR